MALTLVDFDTPLNALRAEIAQAKQNSTYAADVSDKKIVKTLADLLKAALAITDGYFKKVIEHHEAAKKAIDAMGALIESKGKKLSDKDIDVLETSARFIRIAKEQLSTASREAFPPLEQFRGGWPAAYKGLLSKPVLIEPLVAGRTKSIEDGKKVDTLNQRVEQYFVRAVDLVKIAKQAVSKDSVLAGHEAKAIQDFKSGALQCKMSYDEFARKARTS